MMLSGVGKSGSPISRWTTRMPCFSRALARASTSKAPTVPIRLMRWVNFKAILLGVESRAAAVDHDRLASDISGLRRAEVGAEPAHLGGVAVAPHRQLRGAPLELFLEADAGVPRRARCQ